MASRSAADFSFQDFLRFSRICCFVSSDWFAHWAWRRAEMDSRSSCFFAAQVARRFSAIAAFFSSGIESHAWRRLAETLAFSSGDRHSHFARCLADRESNSAWGFVLQACCLPDVSLPWNAVLSCSDMLPQNRRLLAEILARMAAISSGVRHLPAKNFRLVSSILVLTNLLTPDHLSTTMPPSWQKFSHIQQGPISGRLTSAPASLPCTDSIR